MSGFRPEDLIEKSILECVANLRTWKRRGQRAPHKPLLVLFALGRLNRNDRLLSFRELEKPLTDLLRTYGPHRKSFHPEYPFWRLQQDGLWEVPGGSHLLRRKSHSDPLKSELLQKNVKGGFPAEIYATLAAKPELVKRIAEQLVTSHFPESIQEDILRDVGLACPAVTSTGRSSDFRPAILRAYEHRCAVCGFDLRMGNRDLALEAAHIKWRQAGGPDKVNNGLALCAFHHKALDSGAIGINDEHQILVSSEVHGGPLIHDLLEQFKWRKLQPPTRTEWKPDRQYLRWHFREVFKPPWKE